MSHGASQWLSGKESICIAGDTGFDPCEDPVFDPWEDPLEKEMATFSSILVWKIPWTEEPGRLQFVESQRSWTRLSDSTTIV